MGAVIVVMADVVGGRVGEWVVTKQKITCLNQEAFLKEDVHQFRPDLLLFASPDSSEDRCLPLG